MYILSTGCQWAALPKDLPPRSTVNDYFHRWEWDGTLDRIHHALYVQCRALPSVPMTLRQIPSGILDLRAPKDHLTNAHAPAPE